MPARDRPEKVRVAQKRGNAEALPKFNSSSRGEPSCRPAVSATWRLVGAYGAGHVSEGVVQVCSQAENDGDNCDRNTGRDKAILDSSRGILVATETPDPLTHCLLLNLLAFQNRPREQARYGELPMGEIHSENLLTCEAGTSRS
jgi:hypothetical protein